MTTSTRPPDRDGPPLGANLTDPDRPLPEAVELFLALVETRAKADVKRGKAIRAELARLGWSVLPIEPKGGR